MNESSSSSPAPELDRIDLDAIQIHFEVEDRWERYRTLQQCTLFLVKHEKVYSGSETNYLKKMMVKHSEVLIRSIAPEVKVSEALELLCELLKSSVFPDKEATPVERLSKHITAVLS